jgi:hypothetical protein
MEGNILCFTRSAPGLVDDYTDDLVPEHGSSILDKLYMAVTIHFNASARVYEFVKDGECREQTVDDLKEIIKGM